MALPHWIGVPGLVMAICSSCGGSGIQRISMQRFRTCQVCLGRGVIAPAEHASHTIDLAGVIDLDADVRTQVSTAPISAAAASSSAAR